MSSLPKGNRNYYSHLKKPPITLNPKLNKKLLLPIKKIANTYKY